MSFCEMDNPEDLKILQELVNAVGKRSLDRISYQINRYDSLRKRAQEQSRQRREENEKRLAEYEEELRRYEEDLSYEAMEDILSGMDIDEIAERIAADRLRQELEKNIWLLKYDPEELTDRDIEETLKDFEIQGYIELDKGEIKITSKGTAILARGALRRILDNLAKKDVGAHTIKEMGFGSELSLHSRPYEVGDDYGLVDVEGTLLNALEREPKCLTLETRDFQVYETVHQSRLCAGLIIDESGSMRSGRKIDAAIDTSLALSELIRREPKDSLKVFIFSDKVREIKPWDIVNTKMAGGTTDIRGAMRAFREAVATEPGDKQAYLITDTEPNTENGCYVGFNRAVMGVMEEALRYRQENITLNIIMLDQNPSLKEFARMLARSNLGRAFFTSPKDLGAVIIEDYLTVKKERY